MASNKCYWCESTRLERRNGTNELTRTYVCLECGADAKTTIVVNIRSLTGLIRQGKKILATKLHRVNTGVGLKEAKEFIDELANY